MSLSSYRPGAWFGVFGSTVTLLLPESQKTRVAALWELVDDGAGFDEVLDAVLQAGLGALPGLVLVGRGEADGEPTTVLARGDVRLTGTADGDDVEIDGSSALTWVECTFTTLESLAIEVGGADDHAGEEGVDEGESVGADDLPIIAGLVRVSRVDQPAVVDGADAEDAEDVEDAEDEAPAVAPEEEPTERVDVADVPAPAGPPPAPLFADDPLSAPLPSTPDQLAGQASEEPADHDGLTRAGGRTDSSGPSESSRELLGIPGQPSPPRVFAPVATLRFSTGEVVDVDRVVLIGRAPEARRFTSTEQPRLVKVHSPLYEISSTHVEVRPGSGADHGTAVVTDMGSTNGTVLDQPGVGAESLRAGVAVQLLPGATINLGDGVSIEVTRP